MNEFNSFTYLGEGHHTLREKSTDLIVTFFEVLPEGHLNRDLLMSYKRSGANLIFTHKISLRDAINAAPVQIRTLDGRMLLVSNDEIISPATVKCLPGEGLPIFDKMNRDDHIGTARGNLFIKYDI